MQAAKQETEFRGGDRPHGGGVEAGPISFDGLLVQCAGRVIRAAPGKDVAEVHDYHDPATPILAVSLQRRMPGYRALGFTKP
ncbi:hypothetical protein [Actinoplanes sp. NBRC 101535]|uniref:hypothetical protein n=1 Tax=Actinoplanes sp. NBRC 101535 TaxID=3032196 RepID=UPI0024A01970|nr:hypothetical protein [Actinoplanes sp. NBRC 101535]GLY01575.1 hypothetical protein Acsp01_19540 [Actinoplanes sp. NBRC 101535]